MGSWIGRARFSSFVTAACAVSARLNSSARLDFQRLPMLPAVSMPGPKKLIQMYRAIESSLFPRRNRPVARSRPQWRDSFRGRGREGERAGILLLILLSLGVLSGCDRMVTPRQTQLSNEAE